MKSILEMNINEMAKASFDCECGKHHILDIQHMSMGKGVISELPEIAKPFKDKKVFVFGDSNTYKAAGEKTVSVLSNAGYDTKSFFFECGNEILIPDEKAVGRLFMELEHGTGLIVGVGSGTLNDMGKFLSSKSGIPYIIVCTAPSMDGYASDASPLICDGFKISFPSTLPYAILGDTDIMKNAPMHLIHAGFGDVIGKMTALADWYLAKEKVGEYCCETCVTLVNKALKNVIDNAEGIAKRDETATLYLIEALTLTGVAMGLIGVSRPASGSEHLLSHFWEMDFIARGIHPELHGIKVGIGTPIVAQMFELMKDEIPESAMAICPTQEFVEDLLTLVGAPVLPTEIAIDRDLFYNSLLGAHKVRARYGVFTLAVETGKIEECAKIITERIYG